jgi:hypothetical protein
VTAEENRHIRWTFQELVKLHGRFLKRAAWCEEQWEDPEFEECYRKTVDTGRKFAEMSDAFALWLGIEAGELLRMVESCPCKA